MAKFKDERGGHVRIYWSILDSPAWRALSFSQQALYIACRRKLTLNSNGNIELTLAGLKEKGFVSSATLGTGLRALRAVGLIATTRDGGRVARGQTIPSLYRFTDEDSHEWRKLALPAFRATNEWQKFATVEAASAAIKAAELAATERFAPIKLERARRKREKNSSIQKLNRHDTDFEVATIQKVKPKAFSDTRIRIVGRRAELAQSLVH